MIKEGVKVSVNASKVYEGTVIKVEKHGIWLDEELEYISYIPYCDIRDVDKLLKGLKN